MHYGSTWEPLRGRARRYAASAAIGVAACMLRLSHQLYRAGILDLVGVKYAIRWSHKIWQFGWGLVKRKRRSTL
jgi:hypothetical protein